MKRDKSDDCSDALIIHANHYRFAPMQSIKRHRVYSRMQLCCHSGQGLVTVNRQPFKMRSGSLLILPWKHEITYNASRVEPFYVSGLHLIPYCTAATTELPWFQTPHHDEHPLANVAWMQDRTLPHLDQALQFQVPLDHSLFQLMAYVCTLFSRPLIDEQAVRSITHTILHEWNMLSQNEQHAFAEQQMNWPPTLRKVCAAIQENISAVYSLNDYARLAQCSSATLHRQAIQYLKCTLSQWQRQLQLQQAAQLLRSSTLSVSHIAQQCGFNDPLYFSRSFKKMYNQSPRLYRNHFGIM